jgi:hypothetical protein
MTTISTEKLRTFLFHLLDIIQQDGQEKTDGEILDEVITEIIQQLSEGRAIVRRNDE